jgi:Leucine-rich repeat (LRR) protein
MWQPTGVVLTEAMISQKTRLSLKDVRRLSMWGCHLSDVSIIRAMPNLEIVSFSCNQISSLKSFAQCRKLTDLALRGNQISDFSEITHLADLPHLQRLWLSENPIASHHHYRAKVLQLLPMLATLDDEAVVADDRLAPVSRRATSPLLPFAAQPPRPPRVGDPGRDDQRFLTAILSLLPELSTESLWKVVESIEQLCAMREKPRK